MLELIHNDLFIKIIANIVSLTGTLLYCYGRFKKDKSNVLTFTILSKIFAVLTYVILGTIAGAYAFLVHIPSNILAKVKEDKKKKWHILFVIFEICYILIGILTFPTEGIKAILICIASTITLISIWYLNPQLMRLVSMPNSLLYLTFYFMVGNIIGGISEVLVISSNLLSYLKYRGGKSNG